MSLWNGRHTAGTALLVSNLDFGLECLLSERAIDSISTHARNKFFETLTGFSDPFVAKEEDVSSEFECSATVWNEDVSREIIGRNKQFSLESIAHLEHIIDGHIGSDGVFRGKVKAFGNWLDGEVEIPIHERLVLPKRRDSSLGPFDLFIATMEFLPQNTSHSKEEYAHIKSLAKLYSGFMLYRDGLRVMPYGREDSDFFEIEQRRSKQAGREFWNHRQMFGRVAISKSVNPNLRNKAGREGIVDNRASKALKDIVENILMQSARRFFGSNSEIRKEILPERNAAYNEAKLEVERKRLKAKQRRDFRNNLRLNIPKQQTLVGALKRLQSQVAASDTLSTENSILKIRDELEGLKEYASLPRPRRQSGQCLITFGAWIRMKIIRRVGLRTARKNAGSWCRSFSHQI